MMKMEKPNQHKWIIVMVSLSILTSCGERPNADRFVGMWFGGGGDHEINFYRLSIQYHENGVVPEVRDVEALRSATTALDKVMNTLEHYVAQGANVDGAVPMSLEWAAPGQKELEKVYVAYFLPEEDMVIGNGLEPMYYHEASDTLRIAIRMPCLFRSMDLANSDGC